MGNDTLGTLLWLGILGGGLYLAYKNKDKLVGLLSGLNLNLGLPPTVGGGGGGTTTVPTGTGGGTTTKPPKGGSTGTVKPPVTVGGGAPISFCAAGDWGSGRNGNWKKTVATMQKLHPKVVLVVGDQSYTKPAAFKPVTDAIKKFAVVIGADGNHDGGGYAANFNGGYSNSVHTIGNTSFMSLNSNSVSSAISYAKANMSKMTGRWKVVFFHHPVYSVKSTHGATMGGIHPVLAAGHVNLCITAHNHTYQRFALKDGVQYVVAGTGGESPYPVGANCGGCPAIIKKGNAFGTFYANAGPSLMSCQFVANGGAIFDSFTLK